MLVSLGVFFFIFVGGGGGGDEGEAGCGGGGDGSAGCSDVLVGCGDDDGGEDVEEV